MTPQWSEWSACTKNRSRPDISCIARYSSDSCPMEVEREDCSSSGNSCSFVVISLKLIFMMLGGQKEVLQICSTNTQNKCVQQYILECTHIPRMLFFSIVKYFSRHCRMARMGRVVPMHSLLWPGVKNQGSCLQ